MLRRVCGDVVSADAPAERVGRREKDRGVVRHGGRATLWQATPWQSAPWLATVCGMLIGVLGTWLVIAAAGNARTANRDLASGRGEESGGVSGDSIPEADRDSEVFAALVRESLERIAAEEQRATGRPVLDIAWGVDEAGRPRAVSVPIAEDGRLPGEWWARSLITAADRERLALAGRMVDEEPGVLPVALPDGRTAIVPLKSVRVRSASMGDFQ